MAHGDLWLNSPHGKKWFVKGLFDRMKRIHWAVFYFLGYPVLMSGQTIPLKTDTVNFALSQSKGLKISTLAGVGLPVLMITYGIVSLENHAAMDLDYSTQRELYKHNSLLNSPLDNYFQFAPAVAAFGLKAAGVKSRNSWGDMLVLYAVGNMLETAVVYTTKKITPRERPNGVGQNSFPSGHTATAFVAAEFLRQEYRGHSVWFGIGGYAMGALIGASRVYNDKHWVSDVVTGAGIGILSTKVVYWTYPLLKKTFFGRQGKYQSFVLPSVSTSHVGFAMTATF